LAAAFQVYSIASFIKSISRFCRRASLITKNRFFSQLRLVTIDSNTSFVIESTKKRFFWAYQKPRH
jgi:hypothetical protein